MLEWFDIDAKPLLFRLMNIVSDIEHDMRTQSDPPPSLDVMQEIVGWASGVRWKSCFVKFEVEYAISADF